jgi:hypothetical protein
MALTYTAIQTVNVTSAASLVTFSSIPGTYTDLILEGSWFRVTSNGNNLGMRLNNDTTSNYSNTYIEADGSTGSSGRNSNQTAARIAAIGGGFTLSATESLPITIQFNSYSNATTYKTALTRYGQASTVAGASVASYRNTAAINTIELSAYSPGTGQFGAGSVFTLYGIKAA